MRLVHETEDNVELRGIFLRELNPENERLIIGEPALIDDIVISASVIVHVEDAESANREV